MSLLYDTGINKAYDKAELTKIFNTKEAFLTSPGIDVMKRQFNQIPNNKQDPARALTDDKTPKTVYYEQVAVRSDFPKTLVGESVANMWKDGTYNDMVKAANRDREEMDRPLMFAPDKDFDLRFNRLDREQNAQAIMTNYFAQVAQEKEAERRIFLTEYGLSPKEVDEVMARQRIDEAYEALKNPKRHYVQKGSSLEKMMERMAAERRTAKVGEQTERAVEKVPEAAAPARVVRGTKPVGEQTEATGQRLLESVQRTPAVLESMGTKKLMALLRGGLGGSVAAGASAEEMRAQARELISRKAGGGAAGGAGRK